ncbi:MAG TPA: sugar phosphate isomerase/epimerase [Anaerolineae bacterium]|nr:sugar phosphate isomerase/epimerase [Anaerolineae bacterium]
MIEVVPPTYGEMSLEENLKVFLEEGIDVVFVSGDHLPHLGEGEVLELAERYRRAGIRICAGHSPGGNLASLEEGERRKAVEGNLDVLHKLGLMGAGIMVFHGGEVQEEEQVVAAKDALLRSISELLDAARREGAKLALENDSLGGGRKPARNMRPWRRFSGQRNFPGPLLPRGEDVRDVIEELNSPLLGACFDTGHGNIYSEVKEQVEALDGRILTLHMQDNEGRADQHMQPPYGTVDWEGFGEALRKVGFDGPILVESGPRGDVSFGRMVQECKALLNDIGLQTGTPFTFRVFKFLTGQDSDARVQCPRCGRFVLYDGRDCSCMCRRWA